MIRNILRSAVLSVAVLGGFAGLLATPTAATAAQAAGDIESGRLGSFQKRSYTFTVQPGQNLLVACDGGPVEVRLYSEGGKMLATRTVEAGKVWGLNNDLADAVRLKVEISNPNSNSVEYAVGVR